MKPCHAAALALMGCLMLTGCSTTGMTADDPCRYNALISLMSGAYCEQNRTASTKNALLDDYRKCLDANVSDPTRCSAILQGLNAYSVNVGTNQTSAPSVK